MTTHRIDTTLLMLAAAMRVQFALEPAAVRAVDRAVEILHANLPYQFDGVELRVLSFSRSKAGIFHVCSADGCSCESRRREWCRHRMLFRLLLCQWAITQPAYLRAKMIEMSSPIDVDPADAGEWDDLGDFLQERPAHVVMPAPASAWALSQDAADALFA